MTTRCLAFAGKDLDVRIPWEDLKKFMVMPGGIVFDAVCSKQDAMTDRSLPTVRFAFTFQNPLVAADVLQFVKNSHH